jgi:hypothetical protein
LEAEEQSVRGGSHEVQQAQARVEPFRQRVLPVGFLAPFRPVLAEIFRDHRIDFVSVKGQA